MIGENIARIKKVLPSGVKLVAVSKFHPVSALMEAYDAGQRVFGENRPQEFASKVTQMPRDVEWHFIGHLQTNKLKLVLPYVSLLQSVDSLHLLKAVNQWGSANNRIINCLLELHLGAEDTKHGLDEVEIRDILSHAGDYSGLCFRGLMGMATNTEDEAVIEADFSRIAALKASLNAEFPALDSFTELSIGMTGDWPIALHHSATIVRIGTGIFGAREY